LSELVFSGKPASTFPLTGGRQILSSLIGAAYFRRLLRFGG
jgi:hypothetical protein